MTIERLRGRIVDCDAHLQMAPYQFDASMGPDFAETYRRLEDERMGMQRLHDAVAKSENVVLDVDTVWTVKGWETPAGFDPDRRIQALDLMGIDRQVLFPIAYFAGLIAAETPGSVEAARHYNDFVLDWAKVGQGRLRPVALIPMHSVEAAIAEASRTIEAGAFAVNVPRGRPPAGLSPADPQWDPFWELLASSDVPLLLHVGSKDGFFDEAWGRMPSLLAHELPHGGEALGPFNLATFHFAPQMYVTTMILGGVFERHPKLRMGVIELSAQWVGPMAEMLDQRVDVFAKRMSKLLSMRPSEYLNRQLRVTPFFFEPVDRYIERYGLEDVYVFSTDFPHPEGGTDPMDRFFERLAPLGDDLIEKFFVSNGRVILPDR